MYFILFENDGGIIKTKLEYRIDQTVIWIK